MCRRQVLPARGALVPLPMDATLADRQARLRVLTFDPEPHPNVVRLPKSSPHTGDYDCECDTCRHERHIRVMRGIQRPRDPWAAAA